MATAYESDSEAVVVPVSVVITSPAGAMSSVSSAVDGGVSCIQGFHPKQLCCNGFSHQNTTNRETFQNNTTPCAHEINIDFSMECTNGSQELTSMNGDNNLGGSVGGKLNYESSYSMSGLSLLSEYYNYIDLIQQQIENQSISVNQVRLSLQYLPCLVQKSTKHFVFNHTSPISQATDISTLFSSLKDISSWYNHGLFKYLTSTFLNEEGRELTSQYTTTLLSYCSNVLLLLPTASTGPQCVQGFEEVNVHTSSTPDSYTLGDAIRIHESVAEILGLNNFVVLFQGVSKIKVGSSFLYWIPEAVSSLAISNAASNIRRMSELDIVQIQAKYETIMSTDINEDTTPTRIKTNSLSRRDLADSAYETECEPFSSTTYNEERTQIDDKDDDVFITQLSPDSSSNSARYSIDLGTHNSDTSSDITHDSISLHHCITPVIPPPPGYTGSSVTVNSGVLDGMTLSPILSENGASQDMDTNDTIIHEVKNEVQDADIRYEAKQLTKSLQDFNVDSEILHEIERQNSIRGAHFDPINSTASNLDQRDHLNPIGRFAEKQKNRKENGGQNSTHSEGANSNESAYISMSSAFVKTPSTQCCPPIIAEVVSPSRSNSSFPSRTPSTSAVPFPFHFQAMSRSIFSYQKPKIEPSGFIRRVLQRACSKWPANLQMVAISSQQGSLEQCLLHVEQGERLQALYLEGDHITMCNSAGESGRVPYSLCRISTAFYGAKSKPVLLAHSQLYILSTIWIQEHVNGNRSTSQPIHIDLVIIKGYIAKFRDEMSVRVGEHICMLYCDKTWVYGSTGTTGKTGFIPRSHCRLTRWSNQQLHYSKWLHPRLPFQADFVFNLTLPPPSYLLENPHIPKSINGQIRMVTRNYTVPGTQYVIKRGINVKTKYCEGTQFRYVATITGTSFWIPSSFTIPSPAIPVLPILLRRSMENLSTNVTSPSIPKPRQRAYTISGGEPERLTPKKKVSFASDKDNIIHSARSSICQSNPELSLLDEVNCPSISSRKEPTYSTIPTARRANSNENFPLFLLLNDSPTTLCGRFFCFQ